MELDPTTDDKSFVHLMDPVGLPAVFGFSRRGTNFVSLPFVR